MMTLYPTDAGRVKYAIQKRLNGLQPLVVGMDGSPLLENHWNVVSVRAGRGDNQTAEWWVKIESTFLQEEVTFHLQNVAYYADNLPDEFVYMDGLFHELMQIRKSRTELWISEVQARLSKEDCISSCVGAYSNGFSFRGMERIYLMDHLYQDVIDNVFESTDESIFRLKQFLVWASNYVLMTIDATAHLYRSISTEGDKLATLAYSTRTLLRSMYPRRLSYILVHIRSLLDAFKEDEESEAIAWLRGEVFQAHQKIQESLEKPITHAEYNLWHIPLFLFFVQILYKKKWPDSPYVTSLFQSIEDVMSVLQVPHPTGSIQAISVGTDPMSGAMRIALSAQEAMTQYVSVKLGQKLDVTLQEFLDEYRQPETTDVTRNIEVVLASHKR